jgi:membrane fusion protein (multidrug efflux system)
VQLDVSQESAQLRAAQAQMQLAALNLQRQENLIVNRVSSQADYDAAKAEWDKATASVEEVKALIEKKTIRAPFGGVIGIRQINLGEYLESGAPIAPLQSLDPIHVDFFLPQHQLSAIKPGQPVAVQADGVPGVDFRGRVNAVNSVIDEATRNVRVQATLTNPSATLRPGMYVDVTIPSDKPERLVTIPATAIQYAPYGDSVFIVEEMKDPKGNAYKGVRQQVVKLGESRGDIVAVISGVQPGEEVVTAGVFKLRQGAPVAVNNAIVPSSNTDPSPEDT